MKIVILDGLTTNPGDSSWAPLEALGELAVYDRTAADVVERAGTRITPQPVGATILLVEPAVGEVVRVREVAKHDRPIGHLRPDHAMPRLDEDVDEMLQVAACEAVP